MQFKRSLCSLPLRLVTAEGRAVFVARARQGVRQQLVACLALCFAWSSLFSTSATAADSAFFIRDSEIEKVLWEYAEPVFRAAQLNPEDVSVYVIADDTINAFVAGGQNIFIHTGLLTQTTSPNEVIGVLAHEAAHIQAGHLARLGRQRDKASTAALLSLLLGAAAMAGGVASGSAATAQAGQGILIGGNSVVFRHLLSYQRAQEAAADQAAITYLDRSGISAKGMIRLFERLADQALVSLQNVDPYYMSHPVPRDRIALIERSARQSAFYDVEESNAAIFQHQMIQAKINGFLLDPSTVLQRYPTSDNSAQARYARGIAYFRAGYRDEALREIDSLINESPRNPYFWELRGQALFETGQVSASIEPLTKAVELEPNAALIRILLAQAMLGTESERYIEPAIEHLNAAYRIEGGSINLHQQRAIAYGRRAESTGRNSDFGRANLEAAEVAYLSGDLDLAKQFAQRARGALDPKSSNEAPAYQRATDILRLDPLPTN